MLCCTALQAMVNLDYPPSHRSVYTSTKAVLRCVHYNQLFNIYTKQSHHVTCLVKSQLTSTNNAFIMKKRLPSAFLSSVDFQPTTMLGIAVYRH
jgi:hypothetical protein